MDESRSLETARSAEDFGEDDQLMHQEGWGK